VASRAVAVEEMVNDSLSPRFDTELPQRAAVVGPDRGGEGEQALEDADRMQACMGAVAFQVERPLRAGRSQRSPVDRVWPAGPADDDSGAHWMGVESTTRTSSDHG